MQIKQRIVEGEEGLEIREFYGADKMVIAYDVQGVDGKEALDAVSTSTAQRLFLLSILLTSVPRDRYVAVVRQHLLGELCHGPHIWLRNGVADVRLLRREVRVSWAFSVLFHDFGILMGDAAPCDPRQHT